MNTYSQLPGFVNAFATQVGNALIVKVENHQGIEVAEETFNREDYSSDPEFVCEVSSFVKRNGGIKDLTTVISR